MWIIKIRIRRWISDLKRRWRMHKNPDYWEQRYFGPHVYSKELIDLVAEVAELKWTKSLTNPIPKTGGQKIEFRGYSKLPKVNTNLDNKVPTVEELNSDSGMWKVTVDQNGKEEISV